ncbi:gamma-butyrobetaine dioxygenase-like [Glandiceps talaboti]
MFAAITRFVFRCRPIFSNALVQTTRNSTWCTIHLFKRTSDSIGTETQVKAIVRSLHLQRGSPLTTCVAKAVRTCDSEKVVELTWEDAVVLKYPYVWLRVNCRCTQCYHSASGSKIASIEDLDVDIAPRRVYLSENKHQLNIVWADDHYSCFEVSFLRNFQSKSRGRSKDVRLWGSELTDKIPTFEFQSLLNDDGHLLSYLEELRDGGLTLTKGLPVKEGHVEKIANRISFIKQTSYGSTVSLKCDVTADYLGNTAHRLSLHTDIAYQKYTPGVILLHCIQQCDSGGESIYADGFKTVLQLQEENPQDFATLCNTHCDFVHKGGGMDGYYHKWSSPTFSFDRHGDLAEVRYSNALHDVRLHMPLENVYPFYKAIKTYDNILHSPDNMVIYKMEPGDLIMLDNTRVLHGRMGIHVTENAIRHLVLAYMDWDNISSKMRTLREKLELPFHDY